MIAWLTSSITRALLLGVILLFAPCAYAAFPSITDTETSLTASDSTSHTINFPTYAAGELVIVQATCDGNPTFTWASGWTSIIADVANGTAVRTGVRRRIMDGSEGSSMSFTTSNAQECVFIAITVTGYDTTTPIVGAASTTDTGSTPDPPNSNPGVAADYKWIEGFGADDDDADATYWSMSFTGVAQVESSSTTTSCMEAMAYRDLNASSLNPGVMNMTAEEEWVAFTFAINPGSGGLATPTPTRTATATPTATSTPTPTATPAPVAIRLLPATGVGK